MKQRVFAELREVVAPDCVLATNTSSLSVTEMGADVGMHFFNPVALMPLVELIRTPDTTTPKLATAYETARRLGKTPVLVQDAPAFVVNRLLTRMTGVVVGALERGNTVEEADAAIMRLGLPMAPSVLLQMVGPRVANHVLHTLHAAYPDRFPLSPTLDNYAEGSDEIVVAEHEPELGRGDHGGGARGAGRRVPPPARGGRCRLGRRHRHLHAARRRLPVLPRRHHEAPRPDGRLRARRGHAARRAEQRACTRLSSATGFATPCSSGLAGTIVSPAPR